MKFRPCIDIHNGKVKQIVGGSLRDVGDAATENFVAEQDAAYYAHLYKEEGLSGGHIILLNSRDSDYYEATEGAGDACFAGVSGRTSGRWRDHGGKCRGIYCGRCKPRDRDILRVLRGRVNYENLARMEAAVGKEHLVLDVSCRKRGTSYYIVTDRWQKFTDEVVDEALLDRLMSYCDEFLVHAVDVEGKARGIETELAALLGDWGKIPITYAGGVAGFSDLDLLKTLGHNRLDVTIGSALDLFGGPMAYEKVIQYVKQ